MKSQDKTDAAPPIALTIAGSDSGGGAGIQADLKTFAASHVYGTSVLTLITAQNTQGVQDIQVLETALVQSQYRSLMADLRPRAAKTGALGQAKMIRAVADLVADDGPDYLVVDPVMISKHGHPLMAEQDYAVVRTALLPQAYLVTPNRFEAAALASMERVETVAQMKEAAKRIHDAGARRVIVKGGHFEKIVRDIYYDGTGFVEFGADRINSPRVHGSGCTFSAAITARLAHGASPTDALGYAREFISAAIANAPEMGQGIAPVNPLWQW